MDTWVKAPWETFVATLEQPDYEAARGYFDHGYMRLEMGLDMVGKILL